MQLDGIEITIFDAQIWNHQEKEMNKDQNNNEKN